MAQTLGRLIRLPRRSMRELVAVLQLAMLRLINLFGRDPVTEPGGPVVSLTTYGRRVKLVHIVIESIARGTIKPSRLMLWLDEEALLSNLPPALRRLQRRGLEVKRCKNYGPHKKYYPYVESMASFEVPLVTADDDVIYPRYWLKKLYDANREFPEAVNCYWAYVLEVDNNGIKACKESKQCQSTTPSFRNRSQNGMGSIFPASFQRALKEAGTAFEACCPMGDDIWLHAQALRSGHRVRQALPQLPYFSFHWLPSAAWNSLSHENVTYGNRNDQQTVATYSSSDIRLLLAEYERETC